MEAPVAMVADYLPCPNPVTTLQASHDPHKCHPAWARTMRCSCNTLALGMLLLIAVAQIPLCKNKFDVFLCIVSVAMTLMVPFFGYMMTRDLPDDLSNGKGSAKIVLAAPHYTKREEHIGRSICLVVSLLGLYVLYLIATDDRGGTPIGTDERIQWMVYFGVISVVSVVGHTTSWIRGCYARGN
ncbi:hypothetical protein ACP70R_043131 [Stipagrostis hirtigluma subsp. patula]